jgi:membrane-associated protein
MNYPRFWIYNVTGAILWVVLFLVAGYWFGNLPWVKRYFQLVILGIIFVSLLPIAYEWYQAKKENRATREKT